ncbi:DUF2158 domain-containing protein [Leptobacterium flavescens]|uniref:DUF2158 domain-containing protein n=1 Tax=Leptobacterium flavescens TaxID=472055 RepID=A0A6P0UJB4_9FLAO|nr:DUF2158 domain-containing protein [Leptobacterium flavescens]
MNELKIGDVVVSKAGGPKMTVYNISRNDVACNWFDGNELRRGGFKKDELRISE